MTGSEPTCRSCGSSMEIGFGLDFTQGGYVRSRWLAGTPERSIWMGLKVKDRDCRTIDMWRCTKCGLLELYAIKPVEPSGS